jgi:hypothetical protein
MQLDSRDTNENEDCKNHIMSSCTILLFILITQYYWGNYIRSTKWAGHIIYVRGQVY